MLKNKIKLIIFDFDGTLVASEGLNNQAISSVLLELGHKEFTFDYCLEHFSGCSVYDIINTLKNLNEKEYSKILKIMHERAIILAERNLQPVKNVIPTLQNINIPKCIASNGERNMVLHYAEITKLHKFFPRKNIFTRELVFNAKPAPDLYLYTANIMGNYNPENCLVIEDSIIGVTAGAKAGMNVIGYTGSSHHPKRINQLLLDAGAFTTVNDITDIAAYF